MPALPAGPQPDQPRSAPTSTTLPALPAGPQPDQPRSTSSSNSTTLTLISTLNPTTSISKQLHPKFANFGDVVRNGKLERLAPHRPHLDTPIDLIPGSEVPLGPLYNLSLDEEAELDEYLDEYQEKHFIQSSEAPSGCPIFFRNKGDLDPKPGTKPRKRLIVNYQALDKVTNKFHHPMPLVEDLLNRLNSAKIFSKIDLISAYHQLRIREGDEGKTAFRTKRGIFEYQVTPFGLSNAPSYFQRFMDVTFKDMTNKFVVIYLDDFLIYSKDEESHIEHVRAVLQRMREVQLYASLEKSEFCTQSIKFLGHQISPDGISADPSKVQAIRDWPVPTTKRQLLIYLGTSNYLRKYVDNFSKIASPLHRLTRKNTPFIWSETCQTAFDTLKTAITSSPVLGHIEQREPFWVETDASDFAVGCVLSQLNPEGDLRPCAYYSRSLNDAERNYCVYEKELLGIKVALETWRHYLEGSPHCTTVLTDHKGLEFLSSANVMNQRHARWHLFFRRFNFIIKYRPGTSNNLADGLSRRPDYHPENGEPDETPGEPILMPNVVVLATTTKPSSIPFMNRVRNALGQDPYYQSHINSDRNPFKLIDGIPHFQDRSYIPEGPLRIEVLETCHDEKLAGHFGKRKTSELVKRKFFWPNMDPMISEYCEGCQVCARAKTPRHLPYGPLMPLSIPERPWSSIALDFITDLPSSEEMTTILTVTDRHSKMGHFIPFPSLPNAEQTAVSFIREIVRLHGLPTEIISDRGTQFTSRLWKRMLECLDIKQCMSSAYHPQTNGQAERTNQTLQQYLRCYCTYHQDDWVSLLPLAEFSFNNTINASTKLTPFYVNYGYHPKFEYITPSESIVPSIDDRLKIMEAVREELQTTLEKTIEDQERYANEHRAEVPPIQVGDLVWLNAKNLSSGRPSKKLDFKQVGPFEVKRVLSEVAFELRLPPWLRSHPVFHASLLEKAKINQFSKRREPEPPAILVENEEEYQVEEVLDSRLSYGRLQYLIDWEGYPPSERCWVNVEDVHAPKMIEMFHTKYPEKPHPDGIFEGG